MEERLKFAPRKFNKHVSKSITVFDFKGLTLTLDPASIYYMKAVILIDQAHYPERLHRLYMINCPWYFTVLYAMFSGFIDKRTSDK